MTSLTEPIVVWNLLLAECETSLLLHEGQQLTLLLLEIRLELLNRFHEGFMVEVIEIMVEQVQQQDPFRNEEVLVMLEVGLFELGGLQEAINVRGLFRQDTPLQQISPLGVLDVEDMGLADPSNHEIVGLEDSLPEL